MHMEPTQLWLFFLKLFVVFSIPFKMQVFGTCQFNNLLNTKAQHTDHIRIGITLIK